MADFFYDNQIKRHLEQFIRLFSGLNVYLGKNSAGIDVFQRVPARYGDASRMAAHILRNNTENYLNTVPLISCYIESMDMAPERRLNPTYQDNVQVYERPYNKETNSYGDGVGSTYTINRHMPVPYDLKLSVDVWTSNTDQQFQLAEQIGTMFNPSVNIRSSSNVFDWSSPTYIELENLNYTSRTIQQGVDSAITVTTWKFKMPIWINPPAKVKRQVLIYNVITNINTVATRDQPLNEVPFTDLPVDTTQYMVVTYEDRKISVEGNKIKLLNSQGTTLDSNTGGELSWATELEKFGAINPGSSQLRLHSSGSAEISDNDIIGLIRLDPTDENSLKFDVDVNTLPQDTLPIINGIIDPTHSAPGTGSLPAAAEGQRYLLVEDCPTGVAWGNVSAVADDIITFQNGEWVVSFSKNIQTKQYVTNANTMVKYCWTGTEWIDAYRGVYNPGFWRLYL